MLFRRIEEPLLAQYAYLIGCQKTKEALIIDPQRDVDRYIAAAEAEGLRLVAAAETHIHADFVSGARELAHRHSVTAYLSAEGSPDWQYAWADDDGIAVQLLRDGDTFRIGNIEIRAVHTPGHTPEHLSYLVTDHGGGADQPLGLASGDFVFVGDLGRPDLLETAAGQTGTQEASAQRLYHSALEFLDLDDYLLLWPGHGAGSACGKALGAVPISTVGYEQRFNGTLDAARRGQRAFVQTILDGQPEPPLYFGRMKRINREGPAVLSGVRQPRALSVEDLTTLLDDEAVVILDTRTDRSAFMAAHLPGALHAPMGAQLPVVAGSYVMPEQRVVLVVDEAHRDEAIRTCLRVGTDRIEATVSPEVLAEMSALVAVEETDFSDLEARRGDADTVVVDVRKQTEWDAGHIPDALHTPHARLPESLDALPRDKTLLVHCQSGVRSALATAYLTRQGFEAVYVNGRFPDWRAAHPDAVVTEDAVLA